MYLLCSEFDHIFGNSNQCKLIVCLCVLSFPLGAPPTTQVNRDNLIRKGFVIRLTLSNGAHGIGEVSLDVTLE